MVLTVKDLELTREAYQKLGFSLTPKAIHPFGTANHLIQLEDHFLELLGIDDSNNIESHSGNKFSFGAFNRDFLNKREGLSMIALRSEDWLKDRNRFSSAGIPLGDPFEFVREAEQSNGSIEKVGFKLTYVGQKTETDLKFFTCYHTHSRNSFFQTDFQQHKNKAYRIEEVIMTAENPYLYLDFLQSLFQFDKVEKNESGLKIQSKKERYNMMSWKAILRRFPDIKFLPFEENLMGIGYRMLVSDLLKTRKYFITNSIPFKSSKNTILIEPKDNFGVLIEFVEKVVQEK